MKARNFRLGYVPSLDGIRGVAVLLVLAFHARVPFFNGGYIGVDIFFVLSGFLITSLLLREFSQQGSINFRNFYIRRFLRLAPALLAMLLILNIVSLPFLRVVGSENLVGSLISMFYVANWVRAFDLYPMTYLSHTWSLAIEEQFYLVWPITLLTLLRLHLSRMRLLTAVIGIALLSWFWRVFLLANGTPVDRVYNGLDTRLDGLLMGCALAVLLAQFDLSNLNWAKHLPSRTGSYVAITACLLILLVCPVESLDKLNNYYWVMPLVSFLTVVLVYYLVTTQRSLLKRFFENKWLVYLGRISYGLYIWHFPIFILLRDDLHLSWIIVATGGSLAALTLSVLSYRLVEQPALKLKSRFRTFAGGREAPAVDLTGAELSESRSEN